MLRNSDGRRATVDEMVGDWRAVRAEGAVVVASRTAASHYRPFTRLSMPDRVINTLVRARVVSFLDQLYERRPFMLSYPVSCAMALVDVRYNPAGVALYGNANGIPAMWNAFDPTSPDFNPVRAVGLFEQIWIGRGGDRYQVRHYQRLRWLWEGVSIPGTNLRSATA